MLPPTSSMFFRYLVVAIPLMFTRDFVSVLIEKGNHKHFADSVGLMAILATWLFAISKRL
jgi:hypothetical protein